MTKTLVVAEKRSVGATIAAVLGAAGGGRGYLEGPEWVVTWCQGHLVEEAMPEDYEGRGWDSRSLDVLPVVPPADGWVYRVSSARGAKDQYSAVKALMARTDIGRIVNACDPDREGELIFRLVYRLAKCRKPVERLWCSSLEDEALRSAFRKLAPSSDYDDLGSAALARSQTDWVIGMNMSRIACARLRSAQSVGRVRTPTLQLVRARDDQIASFKPKAYWKVAIDLGSGLVLTSGEFAEEGSARDLALSCEGLAARIASVERRQKSERPPTLYNTTGIQKDASKVFGMTPDAVDACLQALYEAKLATYPRTDSCYIAESDLASFEQLIDHIASQRLCGCTDASAHDASACVDDAKVAGHPALLPTRGLTAAAMSSLPEDQARVAELLVARVLQATSPARRYMAAKVEATCAGEGFSASATTDVDPGWRRYVIKPRDGKAADEPRVSVPETLRQGDVLPVVGSEVREGTTKPPERYTDATLLAAMEHADRLVEERELKEALHDTSSHSGGLGTPATRAETIKGLVDRGYLRRKGKALTCTDAGRALLDACEVEVKSPELTARLERDLSRIETGELGYADYYRQMASLVSRLVEQGVSAAASAPAPAPAATESLGRCPKCGSPVIDKGGTRPYECSRRRRIQLADGSYSDDPDGCDWFLWKTFCDHKITHSELSRMLSGKAVPMQLKFKGSKAPVKRSVVVDPTLNRPRLADAPKGGEGR